MAITPDPAKGSWRVELRKGTERYRKRHKLHADAVKDEQRVKSIWARGEGLVGNTVPIAGPLHHTLASLYQEAFGTLWEGLPSAPTSWAHIRSINHLLGPLTVLDDLSTLHVDKLIKFLKVQKMSPATINRYLAHLHKLLVWAEERGMMTKSLAKVKFTRQKEPEGRIRWIEPAEELELYKRLPENIADLVYVAIRTGCRREELLTLKLDQINGNRLHIWKTKANKPRTVPMDQETLERLTRLLTDKTMPTMNALRRYWEKAREAMGLQDDEQFVFHACRHTCATRLVEAAVPINVVMVWMGHKVIATTLRYAHVKSETIDNALEMVGTLEASKASKTSQFSGFQPVPPEAKRGGKRLVGAEP